jgi:saccharopine dehydrogenase-like NADP-dependent oxidoreductase
MDVNGMTYRDFTNTFLAFHQSDSVELKLRHYLGIEQDEVELWEKLESIGLFENTPIPMQKATPAQVLQQMLEDRWRLEPTEKDRIVMWHKLIYQLNGSYFEVQSQMQCVGIDSKETAMARTVGIPAAIATLMIAEGKVDEHGVVIPVKPHWFEPILDQMEHHGIVFEENSISIEPRQYP